MSRFKLTIVLLLTLALVSTSLSNSQLSSAQSPGPGEIRLSEADNGRQVELKEGQSLVIGLEANPSTGYRWEVEQFNDQILLQTQKTKFEPPSQTLTEQSATTGRLVGKPETQVMRFAAWAAGQSDLQLVYRRPWEKNGAPLKTFAVKVQGVGPFVNGRPSVVQDTPQSFTAPAAEQGSSPQALPASLNWCSTNNPKGQDKCTPVKNQGSCGSCWAFAANGVTEAVIKINDGVDRTAAEQYLVSCNTYGYSCDGGDDATALDLYINAVPSGESAAGVRYEPDFPYQGANAPCNPPHPAHEKLVSKTRREETPTVEAIKQAINDYGPVSAGVCVGTAFQDYSGGVFQTDEVSDCSGGTNHAIVLTGWDDSLGVWYLRNSWGTGWGENGYMRIKYGISKVGEYATNAVYSGAGTSYSVSGYVRTAVGTGIGDVTVSFGGARPDVTTNSSGFYNQSGFTNGTYTVTPTKDNYTFDPASRTATVNGADVSAINFTGAQAAGLYSISGYVREPGGAGINGATVSFGGTRPDVTTDNNGFYVQDGFTNGNYTVAATANGYDITPASQSVTVSGANLTNINFTGARPTYSISGYVQTASGAGISSVTVSFDARPSVTTDNNGYYVQTGFPNGHPVVTPSKTGYTFDPTSKRLTVSGANLTDVNFTGSSQSYAIRGTVKTAGGLAINGVLVSFGGARPGVTTDNNGYVQTGFAPGVYTVTASLNGYTIVPPLRVVTIAASDAQADFVGEELPNYYSISGRVQTVSGGAISGVSISFGGARLPVTTDSGGYFTQTGFVNGSYTLVPSLNGYNFSPASQNATVNGADVTGLVFTGTQQTYSISGRLTSEGVGITATVYFGGGISTTANSNGYYTQTGLVNGSYTVAPGRAGYNFSPESKQVTINGSDVGNVNFTATPPGYCVSGYARTVNGAGIAGVTIALSKGASTSTNVSGYYSRCGLPYGSVALTPTHSVYTFVPPSKTVAVIRDLSNVDFVGSASPYSISGRVQAANGDGVGNVTVYFGGGYEYTATDSDGYYTQTGFTSDTYVQPFRTGYVITPTYQTVMPTGSNITGINFIAFQQVAYAAVSGYVRDSNGNAIPAATITFDGDYTVTTNSKGFYIRDVFIASTTVKPTHPAYVFSPTSQVAAVTGGDVNNLDFTGTQQVDFLLGKVALQGHYDPPSDWWIGYPLKVELYRPGSASVQFGPFAAALDASGYFIVTGVSPATYDIKVKNPHSLSSKRTNVAVSSNRIVDFGMLREGDTSNNDVVWYEDYDILAPVFGTCAGDSTFDARADVDDSACVWSYDFSLLVTNFGMGGRLALAASNVSLDTLRVASLPQAVTRTALQSRLPDLIKAGGRSSMAITLSTGRQAQAAGDMTQLSLDPPTVDNVTVGSILTLIIKAQAGARGLDGIGAFLNFDPQYLEVVDSAGVATTTIQAGDTLPLILLNNVNNSAGYIDFTAGRQLGSTPVTGDFDLATVRFRVIKSLTSTPVTFDNPDPMLSLTDAFLEGYSILDLTVPLQGSIINGKTSYQVYLPLALKDY